MNLTCGCGAPLVVAFRSSCDGDFSGVVTEQVYFNIYRSSHWYAAAKCLPSALGNTYCDQRQVLLECWSPGVEDDRSNFLSVSPNWQLCTLALWGVLSFVSKVWRGGAAAWQTLEFAASVATILAPALFLRVNGSESISCNCRSDWSVCQCNLTAEMWNAKIHLSSSGLSNLKLRSHKQQFSGQSADRMPELFLRCQILSLFLVQLCSLNRINRTKLWSDSMTFFCWQRSNLYWHKETVSWAWDVTLSLLLKCEGNTQMNTSLKTVMVTPQL